MPYERTAMIWRCGLDGALFSRHPPIPDVYTVAIYTVRRVQMPCVESAAQREALPRGLMTMRQANAVSQSPSLSGPVGSSDPLGAICGANPSPQ